MKPNRIIHGYKYKEFHLRRLLAGAIIAVVGFGCGVQPVPSQTITIEQFPAGEVGVIVYQWDYSGSSIVQLGEEDSIRPSERKEIAEAASAGQIEPVPMVAVVQQSTHTTTTTILTRDILAEVLQSAGWPTELIPEALRVIQCESHGNPTAIGDSGRSVGLFQLNKATWFRYAGTDPDMWHDPHVNAATALATYQYDISRGYQPWTQWSCGWAANAP